MKEPDQPKYWATDKTGKKISLLCQTNEKKKRIMKLRGFLKKYQWAVLFGYGS